MKNRFIGAIILLLCLGCSGADHEELIPDGILSDTVFTSVMIDVQLLEGMRAQGVDIITPSGGVDGAYEKVFQKHSITQDQFENSFSYYQERPAKMEMIYEQVLDSLSKLDADIKQQFSDERKARTDSINKANLEKRNSKKAIPLRE